MSEARIVMAEPEANGRFGEFGGRYVPESLMPACFELEAAFRAAWSDPTFLQRYHDLLEGYAGRPTHPRTRLTCRRCSTVSSWPSDSDCKAQSPCQHPSTPVPSSPFHSAELATGTFSAFACRVRSLCSRSVNRPRRISADNPIHCRAFRSLSQ